MSVGFGGKGILARSLGRVITRKTLVPAVALALLSSACVGAEGRGSRSSAGGGAGRTEPGTETSLLPATPTALPRFDPDRFDRLLAELRGTPVVVNFWASWCAPCTAEAPILARAAREFEGKVQFVGVDILDSVAPARAFIRKFGWPYPSVFDPSGAIRDEMGFLGQPVTVVFDESGNRTFVWNGEISADILARELSAVT